MPFALEIPYGLSLLAFHDPHATVLGLKSVSKELWPPVPWVHFAFQIMIVCGLWLAFVSLWTFLLLVRKSYMYNRRFYLKAIIFAAPLGFVAVESGWMVTELGRQPWIIYGIMKTAQAVTPVPGIPIQLVLYSVLYLLLASIVVCLMFRQITLSEGAE